MTYSPSSWLQSFVYFHIYNLPWCTKDLKPLPSLQRVPWYIFNGYSLLKEAQYWKNSCNRTDILSVLLTLFIALLILAMGVIGSSAGEQEANSRHQELCCLTDVCLICRLQTLSSSLLLTSLFLRLWTRGAQQTCPYCWCLWQSTIASTTVTAVGLAVGITV